MLFQILRDGINFTVTFKPLTTNALSYRNQSIDLGCKSIEWFFMGGSLVVQGLKKLSVAKFRNTHSISVYFKIHNNLISRNELFDIIFFKISLSYRKNHLKY